MTFGIAVRAACLMAPLIPATGSGVAEAASGGRPIYAVVRVGAALADEDRIGVRRAGLMCLPNGAIRWGDIATGSALDQREIVQDALEDAGLPVTPLGSVEGRGGRPTLRLRATVRAAAFKVCARHYLGDAKRLSGDVALDIEWRVEKADGSEITYPSQIGRHIDESHAATLTSIYRKLLGDAAGDLAHRLLSPPE